MSNRYASRDKEEPMTEQQGEQPQVERKPLAGGELSHFEQLAAVTPKKTPLAILIGTALVPVVLWVINLLAPTETVDELKKAEQQTQAEVSGPAAGSPDIDEI
jgi:preprotein translocase subunit Sec61beta